MKRLLLCLTFLLLPALADGQSVTLPPEVRVQPGRMAAVKVIWEGDDVKYVADPALDVFREYDPDPKVVRLRLIGYLPGRYSVAAIACKGGKLSDFSVCQVLVGDGPGPNPPVPPVPPVPPIDAEKWTIMVVETMDTTKLTPGQAALVTSAKVRTYLRDRTKKTGGLPDGEFVIWDPQQDPAGYPKAWQDRWAKYKGKPTPYLVINNGVTLWEGPLPKDVDSFLELAKKYLE